ncbi:protein-L-isoaspartate(D-aspartate) O-methyltransferase [Nannocystis exedens]|uniref:Protein-L-isoaspartate O-methyltransferase n=1 Tax=Nannocystis exedens TaxID=54 RepID=A0A1I2E9X0_9BACT|nr:protein-L-isoaspartate(D-aspartate) O-methyltransferase [Nannocystis exedens]PCC74860.1 protein-L-isoaspartate O-methyltransferase [Nannocystis exedens]SFE89645.1 protein-L-isoaspartate(D-aspartate) O-methyltransferase [Nannocystis exedens]
MRRSSLLLCLVVACAAAMDEPSQARSRMVEQQLVARDITDEAVLAAMRRVPRERFVPPEDQRYAFGDHPLPIGHGATISQPYIVALMTQLARVKKGDRVLDVGTGSGYQAAVLAEMGAEVYSIEVVTALAEQAATLLDELGYDDVHVRAGDGYRGWPEAAPFNAIIVAAAAPTLPRPLTEQLAVGGRLVIPVGRFVQDLQVLEKRPRGDLKVETVLPVRFVPMVGEVESQPRY